MSADKTGSRLFEAVKAMNNARMEYVGSAPNHTVAMPQPLYSELCQAFREAEATPDSDPDELSRLRECEKKLAEYKDAVLAWKRENYGVAGPASQYVALVALYKLALEYEKELTPIDPRRQVLIDWMGLHVAIFDDFPTETPAADDLLSKLDAIEGKQ